MAENTAAHEPNEKDYDSGEIQVLEGLDPVRKRPMKEGCTILSRKL